MTKQDIAKKIDHTLLSAFSTSREIEKLCDEAKKHGFYSVCVNPSFVPLVKKLLKGSDVKVCAVMGFPLGALPTELKVQEAQWLIAQGVDEIDMVMNIGDFKDDSIKNKAIEEEFTKIKNLLGDKVLKVIIETCYLEDIEIAEASELVRNSGADFVKTSTGFGTGGATERALEIMIDMAKESRTTNPVKLKVEASGGVKTLEQLKSYIGMGVERIGTSSGIALLAGLESTGY